jgi:3-hydroxyisobutyrate dehydrogenase-like beta-hydroxyacid dehydrogenase
MKIGFLGAGNVARTFGHHLINAGHTIVVSNSRGPATLADFAGAMHEVDAPLSGLDLHFVRRLR